MKVVVGLGNPGIRYAHTRHNAGFDAVDLIARRNGWSWADQKHRAHLASGVHNGNKIVLAKPQTFMNDSGLAVSDLVRFYKVELPDLLIICDDLDLPQGRVRLRPNGSAGGQHGLESIIYHLGSNEFARIKIGVGRPANGRAHNVQYLLSAPSGDERITLDIAIERAANAAWSWLTDGIQAAMNSHNS